MYIPCFIQPASTGRAASMRRETGQAGESPGSGRQAPEDQLTLNVPVDNFYVKTGSYSNVVVWVRVGMQGNPRYRYVKSLSCKEELLLFH